MRFIVGFFMFLSMWSWATAQYADHLGGSGQVETAGKLAICGDDIFADKAVYTGLPVEYGMVGLPVQRQIEQLFVGWTVDQQSVVNQSVVNFVPELTSPDAIVLAYGLADLKAGTEPAAFKAAYQTMIQALKTAHPDAPIYLANLSPIQPWYRLYDTVNTHFPAYQTALSELAVAEGLTLIDLYAVNVENPKYFVDGVTPLMYGAEFIAQRIFEVVTGEVEATMPGIFSNHMVMQRDKVLPVFGRGKPGDAVRVVWDATGANEVVTGVVDSHGYWMVELTAKTASFDGKTLEVTVGDTAFTYSDILIGDIWFAPGQSNMASVYVSQESATPSESTIFPAEGYNGIRLLHMSEKWAAGTPGNFNWNQGAADSMAHFDYWNLNGGWYAADSYSRISGFSAIAWSFARQVHLDEGVPVGIVEMAVGGTTIESYIPHKAFLEEPEIALQVTAEDEDLGGMLNWSKDPLGGPNWAQENMLDRAGMDLDVVPFHYHPMEHSFLYKSAIEPFVPFAIKGFCWYQGETNADAGNPVSRNKAQYRALLRGWRNSWEEATGREDKLAFVGVQLPQINASSRVFWPSHRQAMYEFWRESNYSTEDWLRLENVGIAVTLEFGPNSTDVHPHLKRPIGERLARMAQRFAYGNMDYFFSGPAASGITLNGAQLRVAFDADTLGDGLQAYDDPNGTLDYFEVAGRNGLYYAATAVIDGNEVVLTSASVAEPVAVRYLYHMAPLGDPAVDKLKMLASEVSGTETPSTNSQTLLTASPFVLGEENFDPIPVPTMASSEGFSDGWEFDTLTPPANWQMSNSGSPVNEILTTAAGDQVLRIYTASANSNSWVEIGTPDGGTWDNEICIGTGSSHAFTLEARLKVTSGISYMAPDSSGAFIIAEIRPDSITFDGTAYACDNASDFVVLRMMYEQHTDQLTLFRNGKVLATKVGVPDSTRSRVFIGDGSVSNTVDMLIDYIRFTADAHLPFVPAGPEFLVSDCGFESDEGFTIGETTAFDAVNNGWTLTNAAIVANPQNAEGQLLTLTPGSQVVVDLVRHVDFSLYGVKTLKLGLAGSTALSGGLTVEVLDAAGAVAFTQAVDVPADQAIVDLTPNARNGQKVRLTYAGTPGQTVYVGQFQSSAFVQEVTEARQVNGETVQQATVFDTVTLAQVKLTVTDGVAYELNGLKVAVPEAIAGAFPKAWRDLNLYYGTVDDLNQAVALSGVDYDFSDVPLYKFFHTTFDEKILTTGTHYLWIRAQYRGKAGTLPPLSVRAVDATQGGAATVIEPDTAGLADPAFNFAVYPNNKPVAKKDFAYTTAGVAVTIDVLANDQDGDGEDLSIIAVTLPVHGVAFISNGQIVYTPNQGFAGADSFTYTVTDGYEYSIGKVVLDVKGGAVSMGFEPEDHFDSNWDGSGEAFADGAVFITADQQITDPKGNVWRTSGDLQSWSNGYVSSGASAQFNNAVVGSFWEVEVADRLPTERGEISFKMRRGTSGSADLTIKGWNLQTEIWETVGTILGFNEASTRNYTFEFFGASLFSKYRVEVEAVGAKAWLQFDDVMIRGIFTDTDGDGVTDDMDPFPNDARIHYEIEVDVPGGNGIIESGSNRGVRWKTYVLEGQSVTLTGHPEENYRFNHWLGINSLQNPLILANINQDFSLQAVFGPSSFFVRFDAGIYGEISSGETEQQVPYGEDAVPPVIMPNRGWVTVGWDKDWKQITDNRNLTAIYEVDPDLQSYTINLNEGWNLISIPLVDVDYEPLFDEARVSCWTWADTNYQRFFDAPDLLEAFWVFSEEEKSVTVTGFISNEPITVTLNSGWNLLGVRHEVPLSEVRVAYKWTAEGYSQIEPQAGSLQPGLGYWIFADQQQTVVF